MIPFYYKIVIFVISDEIVIQGHKELRVEAKEMGIECDVCRRWSHSKFKRITKDEYKVLGRKTLHLAVFVKLGETN